MWGLKRLAQPLTCPLQCYVVCTSVFVCARVLARLRMSGETPLGLFFIFFYFYMIAKLCGLARAS